MVHPVNHSFTGFIVTNSYQLVQAFFHPLPSKSLPSTARIQTWQWEVPAFDRFRCSMIFHCQVYKSKPSSPKKRFKGIQVNINPENTWDFGLQPRSHRSRGVPRPVAPSPGWRFRGRTSLGWWDLLDPRNIRESQRELHRKSWRILIWS